MATGHSHSQLNFEKFKKCIENKNIIIDNDHPEHSIEMPNNFNVTKQADFISDIIMRYKNKYGTTLIKNCNKNNDIDLDKLDHKNMFFQELKTTKYGNLPGPIVYHTYLESDGDTKEGTELNDKILQSKWNKYKDLKNNVKNNDKTLNLKEIYDLLIEYLSFTEDPSAKSQQV